MGFLYLESEDENTARAFGITDENEALSVYGGLKAYVDFVAGRKAARGAVIEAGGEKTTFDVPELPQDVETAMGRIPQGMGIKEKAMYETLVKEQVVKVQNIGVAVRMTNNLKAQIAREQQQEVKRKEYYTAKLAKENPYGWQPDSQSAQDWALSEYTKKRKNYV
jgi:hypothetical protein